MIVLLLQPRSHLDGQRMERDTSHHDTITHVVSWAHARPGAGLETVPLSCASMVVADTATGINSYTVQAARIKHTAQKVCRPTCVPHARTPY